VAGRPPFVGLTGGIGSGKSEALAALERLGAATLSADAVVHELYEDPEMVALVRERWGDEVAPDGVVSRPAVARRAFASDEERTWLESQLWPRVGRRMMDWVAEQTALDPQPRADPLVGHEAVDERTARQLSQEEKAARATYVVRNDGSLEELERKVSDVLERLEA
jgi:dephospho-CoA kinase